MLHRSAMSHSNGVPDHRDQAYESWRKAFLVGRFEKSLPYADREIVFLGIFSQWQELFLLKKTLQP